MIENLKESDVLKYRPLTDEEKKRGILGKLYGNVADVFHATRNGRKYSEELWEKVFDDSLVKESFAMGGIPGELDHPTDRIETCSEKIAIMMPNPPKKSNDGKLVACFDILDTPNGRIAYTLAKYGYKFGISSRGDGEVEEDYSGEEKVLPDSFSFKAFDLVLLPAVKEARMQLVAESLDTSKQNVRKALNEALESSTEDEKIIMKDTIKNLNLNIPDEDDSEKIEEKTNDIAPERVQDIECESKTEEVAEDDGMEIVRDLQVALRDKKELEDKVTDLQEKLSVCYAKEAKYEDVMQERKTSSAKIAELNHSNDALREQVSQLTEQLKQKNTRISDLKKANSKLLEAKKRAAEENSKTLNESLDSRNKTIAELQTKIKTLEENARNTASPDREKMLTENIATLKQDAMIKKNEYASKIAKANSLVEQYKSVAEQAIDKYIDCQAVKIGISSEDIKRRLTEDFSIEDVDRICESLMSYQRKSNSLPFIDKNNNFSIRVSSAVSNTNVDAMYDDTVDESMLRIAGLK